MNSFKSSKSKTNFYDVIYVCVNESGELQTGYKGTGPKIYKTIGIAKSHCHKDYSVVECVLTKVVHT